MADEYDLTLRRIRQNIAADLDEERPDRYVVSDSTESGELEDVEPPEDHEDTTWIDDVADRYADMLPAETVRKLHARSIARSIESNNLRRGNRIIREHYESDQPQLGWMETANYPVQVVHRIVSAGERPRIHRERVRLAAMTSTDLRLFAAEERRNAARDFATRNRTCEVAEAVADEMDEAGQRLYADWLRARAA